MVKAEGNPSQGQPNKEEGKGPTVGQRRLEETQWPLQVVDPEVYNPTPYELGRYGILGAPND